MGRKKVRRGEGRAEKVWEGKQCRGAYRMFDWRGGERGAQNAGDLFQSSSS